VVLALPRADETRYGRTRAADRRRSEQAAAAADRRAAAQARTRVVAQAHTLAVALAPACRLAVVVAAVASIAFAAPVAHCSSHAAAEADIVAVLGYSQPGNGLDVPDGLALRFVHPLLIVFFCFKVLKGL
jgi:hypothetical protein